MGGRGSKGRARRTRTDAEIAHEVTLDITPPTEQVPDPTPDPEAQRVARVNARWNAALYSAINDLAPQGQDRNAWVTLTELRPILDQRGLSRAAQDEHIKRLSREGKLAVVPESNRKTLTDADHAAEITIGGEPHHLVQWNW